MTSSTHPHEDLAAYVLGWLEGDERASVEQHLAACERCRAELAELDGTAHLLAAAAPEAEPPPSLAARTLLAVQGEAEVVAPPPPRRRARRFPAWLIGTAVAAVAAVTLFATGVLTGDPGDVEIDTALTRPGAEAAAGTVRVTNTGIGRVVALRTDALPELDNTREFYEVWFVGPDDRPDAPNRVSAGTFHPDASGATDVRLAAAAVPANYPVLSVTREPRDGDPRRSGPEVLRADR